MFQLVKELFSGWVRLHFTGQGSVILSAALKVGGLTVQFSAAGSKQFCTFFRIDKDQCNAFIVVEKWEMLVDAPIVSNSQVCQAVFIIKSAVRTGGARTDVIQE